MSDSIDSATPQSTTTCVHEHNESNSNVPVSKGQNEGTTSSYNIRSGSAQPPSIFMQTLATGSAFCHVPTYGYQSTEKLQELFIEARNACRDPFRKGLAAIKGKTKLRYPNDQTAAEKAYKAEGALAYKQAIRIMKYELEYVTGMAFDFDEEELLERGHLFNIIHSMIMQVLMYQYVSDTDSLNQGQNVGCVEMCCKVKAAEEVLGHIVNFRHEMAEQLEETKKGRS